MSDSTAEVSIVVDAPKTDVWRALTDPEAIQEYFLGAKVRTDWEVGSPITWSGEWKGDPYEDKGEILTFEPHERLSYSHWSPLGGGEDTPDNYHVVDIQLDEAADGTSVILTQSNLRGGVTDDDRAHRADYERNWTTMLEGLKKVVEGAVP